VDDAALRARLDAWLAAHPGVVCRFAEAADPVAVLQTVPDWTRQPANLLQGRFTVSEPFVVPAGLRMAAAFAAAALLVQLAGNWISYAYYHHQAARIEADAVTRYQQLFPDARAPASGRMAWLEKGLKSHLQGAAGGTTILPMLTRVATALQGSGLETQRIDYTGGVLTLDVDARALADIDSLKQRLGSRGFHAEIVSANAQGGLIRGRLRVGEGT
jgi:type II secretion system protein L